MKNKIKRIDIKEFREKGYLQEVNRNFLHPLGLALEIVINDDGTEQLGGVWDYRDDTEGIYYAISDADLERRTKFKEKKNYIEGEMKKHCKKRKEILGFDIEPLD